MSLDDLKFVEAQEIIIYINFVPHTNFADRSASTTFSFSKMFLHATKL